MALFQFGIPYTGTIDAEEFSTWYFDNVPIDIVDYNGLCVPIITDKPILNNLQSAYFVNTLYVGITHSDPSVVGQAVTITFLRPNPLQYGREYRVNGGVIYPYFSSVPWIGDSITLPCSFDGGPFINTLLSVNRDDVAPYIIVLYEGSAEMSTIKISGRFGLTWFFSP